MTTDRPRLELYVRSLLPDGAHERQEAAIERLDRLDENDDVSEYSVVVWGKQVAPETAAARTREGEYILNRIAEFKQWALGNTVSLESFYQERRVDAPVTAEAHTAITLPVMGLAEYHGGELTHVAPCTDGDTVHTVVERLEQLENGQTEPPTSPQDPIPTP
ncbi:hypothetical protein QA599_03300 [Haloarculaceae archaeon H-GB1-1]|nr:hypothetical protein [Haloarculaceae archaeon H-GB1-1]